jgi:sulfur-oxidizing protein SoxY
VKRAICYAVLGLMCVSSVRAAWEQLPAVQALLNGGALQKGGLSLDLPTVTQEGSSVGLTVEVRSPLGDDYVEELHLLALGNPSPELARFWFSPVTGHGRISTRVRLDGSQRVVALARTHSGQWLAGDQEVRVTVSGCLSRGGRATAPDLSQPRVRAPERMQQGTVEDVRTLIQHAMETGLRSDASGQLIPERIIKEFTATYNGEPILRAELHRAIAANPYLVFPIAPHDSGTLQLQWLEDTGQTAVAGAVIDVSNSP